MKVKVGQIWKREQISDQDVIAIVKNVFPILNMLSYSDNYGKEFSMGIDRFTSEFKFFSKIEYLSMQILNIKDNLHDNRK